MRIKIRAFTLIELLVVMVIIVFLTVIVGSVLLFGYKSLLRFRSDYNNVSSVTLFYENLYDDFKSADYIYFKEEQLIFIKKSLSFSYEFEDGNAKKRIGASEEFSQPEIIFLPVVIKTIEYCDDSQVNKLVSFLKLDVSSDARKYQFCFKKVYDSEALVNWELSNMSVK